MGVGEHGNQVYLEEIDYLGVKYGYIRRIYCLISYVIDSILHYFLQPLPAEHHSPTLPASSRH